MSDAPLKTTFLSGNLQRQSDFLNHICDQSTNLSLGLWNICISSIFINTKDQNGVFCSISCNLVKDKRINVKTKNLETYNPSISAVFLKGRKIVYLDKTWFTINNQCTDLKLFFTNIETQEHIEMDCELYITVLLQRIK
jgi:hypothetical protein